jgi:hypothetical protein
VNREQIYAALFDKVATVPGIVTASRRLKHWNDVNPADQPAIFQTQNGENAIVKTGFPTKWSMDVDLYLYCHAGNDPDVTPATDLNNLLDAIEKALKPDYSGYQNLGGLVYDCRIDGKVETDEGTLGPQSVAIIPIKITVVDEE